MKEEFVTAPEEIKHTLDFKDKDGYTYHLSPQTYKHIKRDHAIDNPVLFISDEIKGGKVRWIKKGPLTK